MVADYNTINDMVVKLTEDLKQATSDKSAAEKSLANANFERSWNIQNQLGQF